MRSDRYQIQYEVHILLPVKPTAVVEESAISRHFFSGAAQESNLPSVGLPRLTGFDASAIQVRSWTEAGFKPRFRPSTRADVR